MLAQRFQLYMESQRLLRNRHGPGMFGMGHSRTNLVVPGMRTSAISPRFQRPKSPKCAGCKCKKHVYCPVCCAFGKRQPLERARNGCLFFQEKRELKKAPKTECIEHALEPLPLMYRHVMSGHVQAGQHNAKARFLVSGKAACLRENAQLLERVPTSGGLLHCLSFTRKASH
eukprot:453709-Pelagomonas_calceolata.AAC.3